MKDRLPAEVRDKSKLLRQRITDLVNTIGLPPLNGKDNVDKYYYIQKETEMLLLEEKLEESLKRTEWLLLKLNQTYEEVLTQFSKDTGLQQNTEDKIRN